MRTRAFLLAGLLVALLLAGAVSGFASSSPDALDAVLRDGCAVDGGGAITGGSCIAERERASESTGSPLAGYGIRGPGHPYLSTGIAGAAGVLVTFAVGAGLCWLVRRRRPAD
jgi:cobalt/nickel transport protein